MLLFFDFGSGEIILIIMVLFIVLGPKRLPEVARTMGKAINEMKRASAGFKNEINKEVQKLDRETRLNEFLRERESEKLQSPSKAAPLPNSAPDESTSLEQDQQASEKEKPALNAEIKNENIVKPNKTNG